MELADKMQIQVHIDWQDTYKVFICSRLNGVSAIENQLEFSTFVIFENGPEGLLEIPKLTIVHLQEWGRSEQG